MPMTDWPPPSWGIPQLLQADVDWVLNRTARKIAEYILPKMRMEGIKSVIEFGCGTGLLAAELPAEVQYVGLDMNDWFLGRARDRNSLYPAREFCKNDVREWSKTATAAADLSMAWSFLKHFGLDEFDSILSTILGRGRFSAFNVSHLPADVDDGVDFHHVYVTEERVKRVVEAAGHEIVDAWQTEAWAAHNQTARGVFYWTRRKETVLRAGEGVLFDEARPVSITSEENKMFDREAAEKAALTPHPSDIVITTPVLVNGKEIARLEIGGPPSVKPDALHEYSLRWLADGTPVLYHKGKRVTKKWRLSLDVDVAADEHGGNANTDG